MSAQARPPRPRLALRLALLAALVVPVAPAQAAGPTVDDASTQVVQGTTVDVSGLARIEPDAAPSARAVANARIRSAEVGDAIRPASSARSSKPSVVKRRAGSTAGASGGDRSIDTAEPGFSSFGYWPIDPLGAWPLDANVAVSPTWVLSASAEQVSYGQTPDGEFWNRWYPYTFFALPANEYYWRTTVAWSTYRGRFVAVLASHQDESAGCANGYLTIAISTTNDPAKPWTRFRVAMADAYSLNTGIGFSDDKVVLTNDQWDLSTGADFCEDGAFEGSRVRVVDWADLIDAGTLTVRDVTPSPATEHFAWVAAQGVPGTASALAGTDVHLVGDRFDGSAWGNVVYAKVTGSAKTGTAAVTGYVDLTMETGLRALEPPPATIAAMPSGNGFQDEHIISAAWRAGVLWFSANDTCRLDPDPDFRACARFVRLDTTTSPPTVSDDGLFVEVERDTFLPLVGMSRDGKAWFGMSASSALAHEPIDQYATYREPGVAIADGPAEIVVHRGSVTYEKAGWGEIGSMVNDPSHVSTVWQAFPSTILGGYPAAARGTRLTGGISADPGVATVMNNGNPWSNSTGANLRFQPTDTSPVVEVRISASGTTDDTPDGPRLVQGIDSEFGKYAYIDTGDPAVGGVPGVGPHSAFVQFRMSDGTYSTPAEYPFDVETTKPTLTVSSWFYVGKSTAATTAVVRTAWAGVDAESGMSQYVVNRTGWNGQIYGPGPGGRVDHSLIFGKGYTYSVQAGDNAGNTTDTVYKGVKVYASQGTTSAIKYTNTWKTQSSSSFLGSSTRYATAKGATATFTFSGRAAAIVSTRGSTRGKFEVWVDGVRTATVDLHLATRYRTVVWATSWPTTGTHKVMIKVLGTSGHPRVDLDAFLKF